MQKKAAPKKEEVDENARPQGMSMMEEIVWDKKMKEKKKKAKAAAAAAGGGADATSGNGSGSGGGGATAKPPPEEDSGPPPDMSMLEEMAWSRKQKAKKVLESTTWQPATQPCRVFQR